jgi:RNA polymerase I-specific transcription initiation factor RRN7
MLTETSAERKVIEEYFPVKTWQRSEEVQIGWEREATGSKRQTGATAEDGGTRTLSPGEQYAIYNTEDEAGEMPESSEVAIGRAGQVTGVGAEMVSKVTEKFERRLLSWWQKEKRSEEG